MSGGMSRIALALAVVGLSAVVAASTAGAAPGDPVVSQVADLNPGPAASNMGEVTTVGSTAYFAANDGTHDTQLWRTNGGPLGAGTSIDLINPSGPADPSHLVNASGTLFFAADDGVHGTELWKKLPGSPAQMVENINTTGGTNGPNGSDPTSLVAIGGTVFLVADDGVHGTELWKSDGTTTSRVTNFTGAGPVAFAGTLAAVGTTLLFPAVDGTDGEELYKVESPYTLGSQTLVENINPSTTAGSHPFELTAVNGRLMFVADDGSHGDELWKSESPFDAAHTSLVRDIRTGTNSSSQPDQLTAVGTTAYFYADDGGGDEIWKSESPYTDASQVTNILAPSDPDPDYLTAGGGALYFVADTAAFRGEVWKTTGTGATMITDVNPGGGDSDPVDLAFANGKLYFRATEPDHGAEPYVYDGASVSRLKDINPGPAGSFATNFAALGSSVLFRASDGVSGAEPWKVVPQPVSGGSPPPAGTPSALPVAPPAPTGQRAAALKKCKQRYRRALRKKRAHDALTKPVKKHLRKRLGKCRRRARALPV
jgi:ELWxxDGT repeat protein